MIMDKQIHTYIATKNKVQEVTKITMKNDLYRRS